MASQVCTGEAGPEAQAVGMPLPGREGCLQQGEICVRGTTLFLGYYSTGRLECPLDADGWFVITSYSIHYTKLYDWEAISDRP